MKQLFSFPNPVNEVSARLVAGGVVVLSVLTVALHQRWLLLLLAYGFVARLLTGPTLSPLGQVATRVLTPRLPFAPKPVAGPPKRFAQAMGATFSVGAVIARFGFGSMIVADVLVGMIIVAATLESVFGYCLGCKAFAVLIRLGLIPEEICEQCSNIWAERPSLGRAP
jgi:hypothetical protein